MNMYIIDYPCYKCNDPFKVAVIKNNDSEEWFDARGSTYVPVEDFTTTELEIAKYYNVKIELKHSKTAGRSYSACCCNKCDGFAGSFKIFTNIFVPAMNDVYKYLEIDLENLPEQLEHLSSHLNDDYNKLLNTESSKISN